MSYETGTDTTVYSVVMNHEEQYSIWPAYKAHAPGWNPVGKEGSKDECLAYIDTMWRTMQPKTLRQRMSPQTSTPPTTN